MSAFPAVLATPWVPSRAVPVDSSVVVTRRIDGRLDDVIAQVPGAVAGLVLRAPFVRLPAAPVDTWATTGRLEFTGLRLAKFARVEIEISQYSQHQCLVEVRPVSPNSARWGQRRFDRYFRLVHAVADALASRLDQVSFQRAA